MTSVLSLDAELSLLVMGRSRVTVWLKSAPKSIEHASLLLFADKRFGPSRKKLAVTAVSPRISGRKLSTRARAVVKWPKTRKNDRPIVDPLGGFPAADISGGRPSCRERHS